MPRINPPKHANPLRSNPPPSPRPAYLKPLTPITAAPPPSPDMRDDIDVPKYKKDDESTWPELQPDTLYEEVWCDEDYNQYAILPALPPKKGRELWLVPEEQAKKWSEMKKAEKREKEEKEKERSYSKKKGVKLTVDTASAKQNAVDENESMADDPDIKYYTRRQDVANRYDIGTMATTPAFMPLPQAPAATGRLPEVDEIGKSLRAFSLRGRDAHEALVGLPDGSGRDTWDRESMARRVKPNVKGLERTGKLLRGEIMVGPRGGKFFASWRGQRVGGRYQREEEEQKKRTSLLTEMIEKDKAKKAEREAALEHRIEQDILLDQEQRSSTPRQFITHQSSNESIKTAYGPGEEIPDWARRPRSPFRWNRSPISIKETRRLGFFVPPEREHDTAVESETTPTKKHFSRIPRRSSGAAEPPALLHPAFRLPAFRFP